MSFSWIPNVTIYNWFYYEIKTTTLQNRRMISYGKYLLRIYLLTGKECLFPVKSCNIKVDGSMTSMIWKGPSHILWNFVCFPFYSWALSQFKTRSPIWKYFLDIMFESKEAFTNAWWWAWVILACSHFSSNLIISNYLSCKEDVGVSSKYWTKAKERIAKWVGRTTSFP